MYFIANDVDINTFAFPAIALGNPRTAENVVGQC